MIDYFFFGLFLLFRFVLFDIVCCLCSCLCFFSSSRGVILCVCGGGSRGRRHRHNIIAKAHDDKCESLKRRERERESG